MMCLADIVMWVLTSGSGELEQQKARDDGPTCPIMTALMVLSGVNRDHEYMSLAGQIHRFICVGVWRPSISINTSNQAQPYQHGQEQGLGI